MYTNIIERSDQLYENIETLNMERMINTKRGERTYKGGFTLVELILVIALFSIIMGAILNFFIATLSGRVKAAAHMEVQEQARFVGDRLAYEIRRSTKIEAVSVFGTNLAATSTGTLSLDMVDSSRTPTVFSVASGILYMKQGTSAAVALTSNDVSVTNLTFTNLSLSNGRSKHILVNFTLSKPDPAGIATLTIVYPMEMSVEMRGK